MSERWKSPGLQRNKKQWNCDPITARGWAWGTAYLFQIFPHIYIDSSTLRLRCSPLISNFSAECWTRSIVFVSGEVAHELLPKVVRSHQKSMFKDSTVNKCSSTMTYLLNGSFHIFVYVYIYDICISYIWHILWTYHTYQWVHSLDLMDAGVRRQKCSAPGRRPGKPMGFMEFLTFRWITSMFTCWRIPVSWDVVHFAVFDSCLVSWKQFSMRVCVIAHTYFTLILFGICDGECAVHFWSIAFFLVIHHQWFQLFPNNCDD